MPQEKLYIDHDVTPWGVRGLLCTGCNSTLGITKDGWPDGQAYLANSWWRAQCVALGLPAELGPEPGIGAAIRNQLGTIWVHHSEGQWEAPSQDGHHPMPRSWRELYRSFGAHNLVPYDLRGTYRADSMPFSVRYCLENGQGWSAVRAFVGVPEPEPDRPRHGIREWSPRDSLPWLKTPRETVTALRRLLTPDECLRIAELLAEADES